jgi:hypothetical protein
MSETTQGTGGGEAPGMTKRDLFLGLVQSFQMAAMQQMGKVPNPATGETEKDLGHARLSIDMLEMLRERTAGNLTHEEARFLDHVLTEVRLLYVKETSAAPGGESGPQPGGPATG